MSITFAHEAVAELGGAYRIHEAGIDLGPLLSAGLYEFTYAPGTYVRRVAIATDELAIPLPEQVTPALLREIASQAAAAADWLESSS